jgi:hypothetical protein
MARLVKGEYDAFKAVNDDIWDLKELIYQEGSNNVVSLCQCQ